MFMLRPGKNYKDLRKMDFFFASRILETRSSWNLARTDIRHTSAFQQKVGITSKSLLYEQKACFMSTICLRKIQKTWKLLFRYVIFMKITFHLLLLKSTKVRNNLTEIMKIYASPFSWQKFSQQALLSMRTE